MAGAGGSVAGALGTRLTGGCAGAGGFTGAGAGGSATGAGTGAAAGAGGSGAGAAGAGVSCFGSRGAGSMICSAFFSLCQSGGALAERKEAPQGRSGYPSRNVSAESRDCRGRPAGAARALSRVSHKQCHVLRLEELGDAALTSALTQALRGRRRNSTLAR